MIPYDDWEVIYEDSEIDGRRDPQEPEGYGMRIRQSNSYILFPRGTLRNIARTDRIRGRQALQNLLGTIAPIEYLLKGTDLTPDSIIAVACKMHINEEERYQSWTKDKS